MKLNKEICKHCKNRFSDECQQPNAFRWNWKPVVFQLLDPCNFSVSGHADDRRWDDGIVFCPVADWISVDGWPHKDCRYAAEHIASYAAQGSPEKERSV